VIVVFPLHLRVPFSNRTLSIVRRNSLRNSGYGLTARLPVAIQGLVGPLGKVNGMERYVAVVTTKISKRNLVILQKTW
jgi:hypothetical protein